MHISGVRVTVPVGEKKISAVVPNLMAVMKPLGVPGIRDPRKAVRNALENPISSRRLSEIAKGKRSAAIIVNDITRPYPGGLLVEEIVRELNSAGLDDNSIFLVVAYGIHRPNSDRELRAMFGDGVVDRLRVVDHFAGKSETLVSLGCTKSGMPVQINKDFAFADVKITTGLITPHHSAGFSGGRKSVVPGIAGLECLKTHHSFPIRPSRPAMGWLDGNPFHEEALEAARIAGVDFIVNTVDNEKRELVEVVAGDLNEAHLKGVEVCKKIWTVELPEKADVVIASPGGFPRDFDLHQAQKAIACSELACREGGRIILCAEARDGIGKFGKLLQEAKNPQEIVDKYISDGFTAESTAKAYMYARGLLHHDIAITETLIPEAEVRKMFLNYFPTLQDAVDDSLRSFGENTRFVVIPCAADIIPVIKNCRSEERVAEK